MSFGKTDSSQYRINISGESIPLLQKTKFLGIWIDSDLSWETHFDQLALKITKNQHLLRNCKNMFNIATKKTIYYAHVYSHLVYGCTVWGNMLVQWKLKKLQALQNKCVSYMIWGRVKPETYRTLKLLKGKEIIRLQTLKMGYKVQHSQLPRNIIRACITDANSKPLAKTHDYQTRQKRTKQNKSKNDVVQ